MKTQKLIFLIIQRTLSFPFFFGISFIGALIMFLRWNINFVRYGGETIAYTAKTNRKTIQDVFEKLTEEKQSEIKNNLKLNK